MEIDMKSLPRILVSVHLTLYTRVAGGDAQAVWKALQAAESGYRAKGRAPVRLMDRELITAPVEFDWAKYFDAE
jgi:hypothetical protein